MLACNVEIVNGKVKVARDSSINSAVSKCSLLICKLQFQSQGGWNESLCITPGRPSRIVLVSYTPENIQLETITSGLGRHRVDTELSNFWCKRNRKAVWIQTAENYLAREHAANCTTTTTNMTPKTSQIHTRLYAKCHATLAQVSLRLDLCPATWWSSEKMWLFIGWSLLRTVKSGQLLWSSTK